MMALIPLSFLIHSSLGSIQVIWQSSDLRIWQRACATCPAPKITMGHDSDLKTSNRKVTYPPQVIPISF
jgi:hypothetical protein